LKWDATYVLKKNVNKIIRSLVQDMKVTLHGDCNCRGQEESSRNHLY